MRTSVRGPIAERVNSVVRGRESALTCSEKRAPPARGCVWAEICSHRRSTDWIGCQACFRQGRAVLSRMKLAREELWCRPALRRLERKQLLPRETAGRVTRTSRMSAAGPSPAAQNWKRTPSFIAIGSSAAMTRLSSPVLKEKLVTAFELNRL